MAKSLSGIRQNFLQRCYNPNDVGYKNYGARGIDVCPEWRLSFLAFKKWALTNGYQQHLTLDRIDNDKGYYPDNCRFVSFSENCRNKSNNNLITAYGETKCLSAWAEDPRCTASIQGLWQRQKKGLRGVELISQQKNKGKGKRNDLMNTQTLID